MVTTEPRNVADSHNKEHEDDADAKRVLRVNDNGTTHQEPTLTISNAIDSTAFDLNAAAFSETTNISNGYIFDSILLNFSTNESKTITITGPDGTILRGGDEDQTNQNKLFNTTGKNFDIGFRESFKANDNITVTVTQFSSAGTMDCILKVQEGSSTLNGTPVLGAGNEIIGKVKITDGIDDVSVTPTGKLGVDVPLTAFGDLRVAELSPVFQGSFEYTVDNTDLNDNTTVNGGTITQSEAMAVVRSTTTTASTALFQSKQHARYRSGLGGLIRFTALFTSPVSATEQYIGIADEVGSSAAFKNGFMVGYDGTNFGFHRFQNDVKTTITQANWDDPLDGTGTSRMTLDQTKLNVFFIQFQYLGAGSIKLFIENDSTGEMVLVNTVDYSNANITPSVHNPNFHHTMWVNNKATTNDIVLKGSSYGYFVEGKTSIIELHQPQFATGEKQKTSVTNEVAIFTIRNKATYQSKTNFIDILIEALTGSIEAVSPNNLGKVRIVKNATLGGTPSFSDINTSNSVIEVDTSGTTVTGGTELFSIPLAGKNDSIFQDMSMFRVILNSEDTLTIAGSSANSATINASVLWRELF